MEFKDKEQTYSKQEDPDVKIPTKVEFLNQKLSQIEIKCIDY